MTACLFTTWLMEYKLIVETHCSEIRFFSKYYTLLTMHLVTQEIWWRYILFSRLLTHPFCSSWIKESFQLLSPQFSWVAQPCWTICDSMDCSTPGFPVHHQLLEPTQTHVHHVADAIQPSHPLSSLSPPTFDLFQRQGLFQSVSSLHQVAEVLGLQLQHQSFQWIFRTDSF